VIAHRQLLALGFSAKAVKHRVAVGRLHPVRRGVYAVGRPEMSQRGWWMAALLACGPGAVLSHASAAVLWGVRVVWLPRVDVSVPLKARPRAEGVTLHRRTNLQATTRHGIPVTTITATLIDLASFLEADPLEAAIIEADKLDLIDTEALRSRLDHAGRRPGLAKLRETLDRHHVQITDSGLERRFLALLREATLPLPETQYHHDQFRVDFVWPELGLIVETDGLRYHRTPAQEAKDRIRDQAYTAAGLTPLRFTRAQVVYERAHVRSTLTAVIKRLAR
jgi:very-short-patch-repair endonuclease